MTLGGILLSAVVVRVLSAVLWAASPWIRKRLSVSEVGFLLSGVGGLLWVLTTGASPVDAALTAAVVGLSAAGVGATLAHR